MTILDAIQLAASLLFLIAGGIQLREARNCRKVRKQYQAMIDRIVAAEKGVPFQ